MAGRIEASEVCMERDIEMAVKTCLRFKTSVVDGREDMSSIKLAQMAFVDSKLSHCS